MAAVPALLNFNFDSTNTGGCYRIMSRIQGSGDPYDETPVACTPFVPPTLSVPCTAQLGIMVDDETCIEVVYEGYIQPCCQDIESLVGRVPFTVTFTPNPSCKSYEVTGVSAGISKVLVTTPGTGYTPGPPVAVTFTDPAGTLADAFCAIEDNGINTFTFTPGSTLVNGTYLEVQGLTVPPGPVEAYFDIVVAGGIVTSITRTSLLTNPVATGADYAPGDIIEFTGEPWTIGGTTPQITVVSTYLGDILVCVVNTEGSGYTGPTTATVPAPGAGVTALLDVTYGRYNPLVGLGNLCNGTPADTLPDIWKGTTIQICRTGSLGVIPDELAVQEAGCCADPGCTNYTITTDEGFTGDIYVADCTTKETASLKIAYTPNVPIDLGGCFIQGSIVVGPPEQVALVTIVETLCP